MAKQTPYERALNEPVPCAKCDNHVFLRGADFCKVSGKLLLPQFLDVCCCRGKYQNGRCEENG